MTTPSAPPPRYGPWMAVPVDAPDPARPDRAEPAPVVADLLDAVPADRVLLDPGVLGSYLHDEAEWAEYGSPAAVVRPRSTAEVAGRRGRMRAAWRPGRHPRCGHRTVRRCERRRRLRGAQHRADARDRRDRRRRAARRRAARGGQRRPARRRRRARALVPAGPGERPVVDDRRQRRHQRGRTLLREVRRHPRLRARAGGRHRSGRGRPAGRRTAKGVAGYDLVGLMVGSEGTLGRDHRGHGPAPPVAPAPPRARSSASSTPSPSAGTPSHGSRHAGCNPPRSS